MIPGARRAPRKLAFELTHREAEALFSAVCMYQDRILRVAPEERDGELNDDFDVMVTLSDVLDAYFFEADVHEGFEDLMAGIKQMLNQAK